MNSEIGIRKEFPDLKSIADKLFIGANPKHFDTAEYAETLARRNRLTPAVVSSLQKAETIRRSTRTMVYIAGPLTGMDESIKERYKKVSDLLDTYRDSTSEKRLFFGYVPHLHGTDPVKHPDVSPAEVRNIDCVYAKIIADLQVNFLFPTAHGNALEEAWAEDSMIPAIYLNPKGNKLSRLTLGMDNVIRLFEYRDFKTDGIAQLCLFFDEMSAWLKRFPDKDPREFYYISPQVLRTPVIKQAAGNPDVFNPCFRCDNFLLYVKNPSHQRYGQVGELLAHDWNDTGSLLIKFPDKTEVIADTTDDFSWWIK